jgi:hypothetical protein
MIAALEKRLRYQQIGDKKEHAVLSSSLTYIKKEARLDENKYPWRSWMVSPLDIEFGEVIAKGGL